MLYDLWERHRRLILMFILAGCAIIGFWLYQPPVTDVVPLEAPVYAMDPSQAGAEPGDPKPAATSQGDLITDGRTDPTLSTVQAGEPDQPMYVDVKGSVKRPGVYSFQPNDRVRDAVNRAGGFLPHADPDGVNLAQPLTDGMAVWIPAKGEAAPPGRAPVSVPSAALNGGGNHPLVNLNTATADQLMTLTGIGETRARAILAHREKHGPFRTPADLKQVTGIGDKMYEQIRDRITVK